MISNYWSEVECLPVTHLLTDTIKHFLEDDGRICPRRPAVDQLEPDLLFTISSIQGQSSNNSRKHTLLLDQYNDKLKTFQMLNIQQWN